MRFIASDERQTRITGHSADPHLHRKGGDKGNAAYWYSRAGKPVCREPLDAEWQSIVKALLKNR